MNWKHRDHGDVLMKIDALLPDFSVFVSKSTSWSSQSDLQANKTNRSGWVGSECDGRNWMSKDILMKSLVM